VLPVIITFITLQRKVRELKFSLGLTASLLAMHVKLCFSYRRWSLNCIRSSYLMFIAKTIDFAECLLFSFKNFEFDVFSFSAVKQRHNNIQNIYQRNLAKPEEINTTFIICRAFYIILQKCWIEASSPNETQHAWCQQLDI
jgi:hypothetical protein